jgi:hypothetical protein
MINLGEMAVEKRASISDRETRKKYIGESKEGLAITVTTMSRFPTIVKIYMSKNMTNNTFCPLRS